MRIIFTKDLPGTAKKNDIKDVNDGYAKNFLLAKGFAQVATVDITARVEKEKKEAEAKYQKELSKLQALKQDLEKRTFTVKVKVGEKGQIFSGVHEKDVVKAINDIMKSNIEKSQTELGGIIKSLGEHQVQVKLAPGIVANVKIDIKAE